MRFVGSSEHTSPNLGVQVLEMRSSGWMDLQYLGQDFVPQTEWDFRGTFSRVGRRRKEREKILVNQNGPARYCYCRPKSNRKVSAEHSPQFFSHSRLIWNCQHKHLCPDHPVLQDTSSTDRAKCRGPTPVSCHHITLSFLLSMLPFTSTPDSQPLSQPAKKSAEHQSGGKKKKKKNRWNSDFVS